MPESLIEINDAEIIKIEAVLQKLNERQGLGGVNLEGFRQEALDRFRQIGFEVAVRVYTTEQDGLFAFDLDIIDRLEGEFDPDQMVWEATHDVLDLGEGGVIKTEGAVPENRHHHHH